jgi:Flp pilus assembly protein TadG
MKLRFFDEQGAALVEVSLVASLVIVPLMLGAFELGRVAHYAIETENAARAGASYGSANPANAGATGTVTQAAQNDAPDLTSIAATPTTACVCETLSGTTVSYSPSSGTVSCTSATITSCNTVTSTSVQYIVSYTSVPTTASVTPLFKVKGLPLTYSLKGYSALRVLPN